MTLLALIFIIHPGIIAPVVTEYSKTNQAKRLPEIYSKGLGYFPGTSLNN